MDKTKSCFFTFIADLCIQYVEDFAKYIREAKYIIITVKTILTNSRRGKLYEALAFGSQRYTFCPLYLKFWPYLIRIHLCNSADMTENKHY